MDWITANTIPLSVTGIILFVYMLLIGFTRPRLEDEVDQGRFREHVASNAMTLVRSIYLLIAVFVLAFVWGVDFRSVLLLATTTVTLLGVALFASWSILSNVTAYIILVFHPSFKRGTFVRIIDVDNYTEGYIADLTLFNTKLITENREVIMYPNNLLLGRPSLINPRDRLDGIGKLSSATTDEKKLSKS